MYIIIIWNPACDPSLTRLQVQLQGDSDGNARLELVKTTRDSQVIGSFGSENRSRAFSIASKDSKLTDQNSYKVRRPGTRMTIFENLSNRVIIANNSDFRNRNLYLSSRTQTLYSSVCGTTRWSWTASWYQGPHLATISGSGRRSSRRWNRHSKLGSPYRYVFRNGV